MKKNILLSCLFCLIFLSACEQSKKGAWTKADKAQCVSEGEKEIKDDENFKMIGTLIKFDEKEFVKCMCNKLENKYESYPEADAKIDKDMTEEETNKLFMDCLGKEFQDLMKGMEEMQNSSPAD
jgi:dihydroxyacetone kinase-like predicted kinase